MKNFISGDRIEWTYKHWLSSKSATFITKQGTFIKDKLNGKAVVKFDKNKCNSTVPIKDLRATN